MTRQVCRRETFKALQGVGRILAAKQKRNVRRRAALKWTKAWWKTFRNEGAIPTVQEIVERFYRQSESAKM